MPRLASALVSAVVATVLLLAGCGSADKPSAGGAESLFQRRAHDVVRAWSEGDLLERWRIAVIPAQGLTVEPDWVRGSLKAAFGGGWVRTAVALPTTPGTGEVEYADGTVVKVRTLAAQAAYDAMVNPRSGECPPADDGSSGCDWVTVTEAKAVTATLRTARGVATVPAWAFTVQGLSEPIVRVSVEDAAEPSDFEPALPPVPADGRRLLLNGQDVLSQDATSITVTMGSGACDTEVRPHVLETDTLIVVGGTALGPSSDQLCNAMLQLHELTVSIEQPVGTRPVLDAASGRPLLPRMAPLP
jgi:hypothetical protein